MRGKEKKVRNIVVMVANEHISTVSDRRTWADLLDRLSIGLLVIQPQWQQITQDWVTSILCDDIDNDGDSEVVLGSRDGYLRALTREGKLRWEKALEARPWITSLALLPPGREHLSPENKEDGPIPLSPDERIQSGLKPRILALTYHGNLLAFDQNGVFLPTWHLKREECTSKHEGDLTLPPITQICVYNRQLDADQIDQRDHLLLIGTNDQYIHAFDSTTGMHCGTKKLGGSIDRICVADMNSDKQQEILVTTSNKRIYILSQDFEELGTILLPYRSSLLVATNPPVPNLGFNEIPLPGASKELLLEMVPEPLSSPSYQPAIYSSYNGRDLLCWSLESTGESKKFQECWPEPTTFAGQPKSLTAVYHNNNKQLKILVGCTDHYLYILDQDGKLFWKQDLGHTILSMYAYDCGDDNLVEVIVSLSNNMVRSLKLNLQPRKELPLMDMPQKQKEQDNFYNQIRVSWNYWEKRSPQRIKELQHYNEPLYTLACELGLLTDTQEKPEKRAYFQAIYHKNMSEYKKALSILSRLREQLFQYYWTKPPKNLGHIGALAVGDIQDTPTDEIIGGNNDGQLFALSIDRNGERDEKSVSDSNLRPMEYWKTRPQFDCSVVALQTWKESSNARVMTIVVLENGKIHIVDCNGHKNPIPTELLDPADFIRAVYVLNLTPLAQKFVHGKDDSEQVEHVILGLKNKKIHVYEKLFERLRATIETPYGIEVLCACDMSGEQQKQHIDIIAADSSYTVRLYQQGEDEHTYGDPVWSYPIGTRIHCLAATDIDHDGKIEILIGSEDRNLYVLDQDGRLKWRYFLPDSVLCVTACDIQKDQNMKILAGSADGYIYIFDAMGDLDGQIATHGPVNALIVKDMHPQWRPYRDDLVEIVAATDNRLLLIQILNGKQIKQDIDDCWQLERDPNNERELLRKFANDRFERDEYIRAFALRRLAGMRGGHTSKDFRVLQQAVATDTSPVVARALVHAVINIYRASRHGNVQTKERQEARELLHHLAQRSQREMRIEIVSLLHELAKDDAPLSFQYLEGFLGNEDLWVRRMVVRKLSQVAIIPDAQEESDDQPLDLLIQFPEYVLPLLISAANDHHPWIREEAGRGLARYFDVHRNHFYQQHPEKFLKDLHKLTGQYIDQAVITQLASSTQEPLIKGFFGAFGTFLEEMFPADQRNSLPDTSFERLALPEVAEVFKKQKEYYERVLTLFIQELDFVKQTQPLLDDLQVIYLDLQNLLAVRNIDEIEQFSRITDDESFIDFAHFRYIHASLDDLLKVVKQARLYHKREAFNDKAAALLDAVFALSLIRVQYIEYRQQEQTQDSRQGQRIQPEDILLRTILQHWYILLRKEMYILRGRARLHIELTKINVESDGQIQLFFQLTNEGRCVADDVHVTLSRNEENYEIIGDDFCDLGEVSTVKKKNEHIMSFILKPASDLESFSIVLTIQYQDAEGHQSRFSDHTVVLQNRKKEFENIPNPYHGGSPVSEDSDMLKGREGDLEHLHEILSGTGAQASRVVLLIGQKRSGKTSLINHLVKRLYPHVAVAIDLQFLGQSKTTSSLFMQLAQAIQKVLQARGFSAPTIDQDSFTANPTDELDTYLHKAAQLLGDHRLVLLMDEFEMFNQLIQQERLDANFLHYLRSVMQHSIGINFLLAGTSHVFWLNRSDNNSAFFNIAQQHTLTRLKREDAEQLIVEPVAPFLSYDPLALERMLELTGGQPLLIHFLSEEVISLCNQREKSYVNSSEVNIAADKVVESVDFYFTMLWEMATSPVERLLLSLMARAHESDKQRSKRFALSDFKEEFLLLQQPYDQNEVLHALHHLAQEDVIEEESTEHLFRLPIGLFRAWLRKKKSIDSVVE